MKGKRKVQPAFTILLCSSIVMIAVAEGALRIWSHYEADHAASDYLTRVHYYWSTNYLEKLPDGSIGGVPHRSVRHIAVSGTDIEFDTSFRTNNLGYVDTEDYRQGAEDREGWAFVGDSFTVGVGAGPWIPELRKAVQRRHPKLDIYNLGLTAAGFQHFYKILRRAKEELAISTVVIAAVSDDFNRPDWYPHQRGDRLWFCPDSIGQSGRCEEIQPHVRIIPAALSLPEVLKLDAELRTPLPRIYKKKNTAASGRLKTVGRQVINSSALLSRFNLARHRFSAWMKMKERQGLPEQAAALRAILAKIRSNFPTRPIYLVHIPQLDEIRSSRYNLQPASLLEGSQIEYLPLLDHCSFLVSDYHRRDSHFNQQGYTRLRKCIEKLLFTPTRSSS